jgi:WhiB family redox-sensing transcriptional regulator
VTGRVRVSPIAGSLGAAGPVLKLVTDEGERRQYGTDPVTGDDLNWRDLAACAETDPEAFFPEKGGSTRDAKRVCGSCGVRTECLGYALGNGERFGIWGGLSERERRRFKRVA